MYAEGEHSFQIFLPWFMFYSLKKGNEILQILSVQMGVLKLFFDQIL